MFHPDVTVRHGWLDVNKISLTVRHGWLDVNKIKFPPSLPQSADQSVFSFMSVDSEVVRYIRTMLKTTTKKRHLSVKGILFVVLEPYNM